MTSPPESMTHAELAAIQVECGAGSPAVNRLIEEVRRLWDREEFLLEANRALMGLKDRLEEDANQSHCEVRLLRQECIRLRGRHQQLASFIEESHRNALEAPSDEILEAMEDHFPPEAEDPKVAARKALDRVVELLQSNVPQDVAIAILQVQDEVSRQ